MDITTLFQNVVTGASTNLRLMPKYANQFLNKCYNGYTAGASGSVGANFSTTITIPIPDRTQVSNIGSGGINLAQLNSSTVKIITDQKLSTSRRIQTFDQARTPIQMRDQYLAPMLQELAQQMNLDLALTALAGYTKASDLTNTAALTTTQINYTPSGQGSTVVTQNTYTPTGVNNKITGPASPNPAFSRINLAGAWGTLIKAGCPMGTLDCVIDPFPYGNMIGDDNNKFISQYIVGTEAAVSAQQSARLMPQFGATLDYDQLMPTGGATGTHGGLFFNADSLAIAPFSEELVENSFVKQTTIFPTADKKIPFTVQLWHSPDNQGVVIHVFVCYGRKVVRNDWGVYMETALATSS